MNSLLSRFHPTRAGAEADVGFAVTGDLPRPLDAKAFSKLYKAMDKVVKSLQNPRLNLSRSPPCLIDILPDIYLKLKEINNIGETGCGEQQDFYFTTVNNIYDKCRRVNQLFKEHKEEIVQDNADSRKQLINLTIVIAYIFADLKALFNDSAHFDPNFRIAKEEAERWWKATFPGRVIVSWVTFKEQIMSSFPTLSKIELSRLKSTIDLTCNDHVSVFEFDVFTRLFAPWAMLIKNFRKLTFHPGYMASATFENVKTILSKHREKPGSYIFRMSCTKLGFWSIGYVTDHYEQRRDRISQIVVRDGKPIVEALMEGAQKGYYLYPNGEPSNPDLSELMHVRPKPQFQVTEAQFEEYSIIGSTFQECKICNIRDKDIQLDLCGHFMCSKCLNQWLSKGTGCPFCRCEIRSTQAVVMQPFQPTPRKRDSVSNSAEEDVMGPFPPPSYPPPDLPPGYQQRDETGAPSAESGNVASPETPERAPANEQPSGRRPRAPSPDVVQPPVRCPPPDSDSNSSDDPVDETAYMNLATQAQRNAIPLPQPPSSLPTRRSSMTSPSTSPLTSPTSSAVTSPSNPVAMPPTSLPVAVPPTSLPVAPSTSPALVSPTSSTVIAPSSPDGASGGRVEPPPGVPNAKPRSKPTDAKDGDARALKTLPPPPPVPLAPTKPPGATAPPLPPNRPRAASLTPTGPAPSSFRQELRSLPFPPVAPTRGSRSNVLPQPPVHHEVPGSEYHVPSTLETEYNTPLSQEDLYNTPMAQEDLYNTPMAQEDLYNTPMAQEDLYNVPTGAEESEYNVPAALMAASNPATTRRPSARY